MKNFTNNYCTAGESIPRDILINSCFISLRWFYLLQITCCNIFISSCWAVEEYKNANMLPIHMKLKIKIPFNKILMKSPSSNTSFFNSSLNYIAKVNVFCFCLIFIHILWYCREEVTCRVARGNFVWLIQKAI